MKKCLTFAALAAIGALPIAAVYCLWPAKQPTLLEESQITSQNRYEALTVGESYRVRLNDGSSSRLKLLDKFGPSKLLFEVNNQAGGALFSVGQIVE